MHELRNDFLAYTALARDENFCVRFCRVINFFEHGLRRATAGG
jgi:hypothetical protein